MKKIFAYSALFISLISCSTRGSSSNSSSDDSAADPTTEIEVNTPFASHLTAYADGSVLPNHLAQTALDDAVKDFYDQWKSHYLISGCGSGRYYVAVNADGEWSGGENGANTITVSEAHGYGMMITVFMAGYDPDAQTIFDGLAQFYLDHPATENNLLMAWNQIEDCENLADGGDDTATDGDLDIAYSLLLADAQWGSDGDMNYFQMASDMLEQIEQAEINPDLFTVLLGNWTTNEEPGYYLGSRSSDWMPSHFRAFAVASDASLWNNVITKIYNTIDSLQSNFSPDTGLIPDFVVNLDGTPEPAPEDYLEAETDNDYSYNACRDPWRLASDYLLGSSAQAHDAVAIINQWIRTETGEDPSQIQDGYALDGSLNEEASFAALSFVAPLGVAAMVDEENQQWLNTIWDLVTATPLADEEYYGNTLKMLCLITMSGNSWAPDM